GGRWGGLGGGVSGTVWSGGRGRGSVVIEPRHALRRGGVGSEMELPLASHTVNFTGMVLPPWRLNTLLPSLLTGGKMTPPAFVPVHVPYTTVKDAVPLVAE